MREVIHLQIGKAGNAAGTKFWEAVCDEHGINPRGLYVGGTEYQLQKVNVYFNQSKRKRYVPRAVLVDLDCQSIENVSNSSFGKIFSRENFLHGKGNSGNNWARGFYTEGRTLAGSVLECTRREAEKCDRLEGFQMVHSIGGGTGSGLGSLILENLVEEYPSRCLSTFTIFPSPNVTDDRTQTYNAVISLHQLTEMKVETYCMDNKALEYICENSLGMPKAGYENMNYLISTAMAGVTTTSRLPGRLNGGLIRSSINMIPFPRMHYLTTGFAPIYGDGSRQEEPITVEELSNELLKPKNMFVYPKVMGKCMTASYIFRGDLSEAEIKKYTHVLFRKNCDRYVDWLPDNIKTETCPVPLGRLKRSAVMIDNTTAVSAVFKRVLELFDAIHEHRYYIHWYTEEGVCSDELDAAGTCLRELLMDYKKCESARYDDVWHDAGTHWGGEL